MAIPWPSSSHGERSNSFHLLLSDDELKLLKLLAEREGLNPSDYLRMLIRSMPAGGTNVLQGMRLGAALAGKGHVTMGEFFETYHGLKAAHPTPEEPKKKKAK
jgi:hypothetical protein